MRRAFSDQKRLDCRGVLEVELNLECRDERKSRSIVGVIHPRISATWPPWLSNLAFPCRAPSRRLNRNARRASHFGKLVNVTPVWSPPSERSNLEMGWNAVATAASWA